MTIATELSWPGDGPFNGAKTPRAGDPRLWQVWRLLQALGSDGNRTQRELSELLGTALGLTNHLLQTVVHAGWVRIVPHTGQRVSYQLTPKGRASCSRLARMHVQSCAHSYEELRKHVGDRLTRLAQRGSADGSPQRLVLYGRGVLGEIAYVCARSAGVALVGVVDEPGGGFLLDLPCHSPDALSGTRLAGEPFHQILVMAFTLSAETRARLRAGHVPARAIATL